jgi:hypothetical protein
LSSFCSIISFGYVVYIAVYYQYNAILTVSASDFIEECLQQSESIPAAKLQTTESAIQLAILLVQSQKCTIKMSSDSSITIFTKGQILFI